MWRPQPSTRLSAAAAAEAVAAAGGGAPLQPAAAPEDVLRRLLPWRLPLPDPPDSKVSGGGGGGAPQRLAEAAGRQAEVLAAVSRLVAELVAQKRDHLSALDMLRVGLRLG